MMNSTHLKKIGVHTGQTSQISELQNHLQKKSNLHNSFCHSYLIQKSQFAMMVPVVLSLIIHIVFHKQFKVIIAL